MKEAYLDIFIFSSLTNRTMFILYIQSGSFIMLKSDYKTQKIPRIWRILMGKICSKSTSRYCTMEELCENAVAFSDWLPGRCVRHTLADAMKMKMP